LTNFFGKDKLLFRRDKRYGYPQTSLRLLKKENYKKRRANKTQRSLLGFLLVLLSFSKKNLGGQGKNFENLISRMSVF
jgi:hypothetical protein